MSWSVLIGLAERNGQGGREGNCGMNAADVLMIGRPLRHQNIIIFIAPPASIVWSMDGGALQK